jgi:hypothetical protein
LKAGRVWLCETVGATSAPRIAPSGRLSINHLRTQCGRTGGGVRRARARPLTPPSPRS